MTGRTEIGRIGIWSGELRFGEAGAVRDAAAELDELGFGAVWIPGGVGGDVFGDVERLLLATKRTTIATGIINVWKHEPVEVGDWWHGLASDQQARLMLGFGISHAPLIGAEYRAPLTNMRAYLDGLDSARLPVNRRCLAALGPKMLELARDRTAGAHPYLVMPEHTAFAREILGPDALLAPEQGVILETDPDKARAIARATIADYLGMSNYTDNWRRFGFTDEDVTQVSDRLMDALFAWGTPEQIARRIEAHFAAGADHVCLQVVRGSVMKFTDPPLEAWRTLAALLL